MRKCILLLLVICFSACATQKPPSSIQLNISSLIEKEDLNARALEIYKDQVYFAGANGWLGKHDIKSGKSFLTQIDSAVSFRALAVTNKKDRPYIYLMNIGSPAYLWEGNDLQALEKTWVDASPNVFYDALVLNPNGTGFALGDPVENCMSLIQFNAHQYKKISCDSFIQAAEGEAAFAASDTNIKMIDNTVWLATGGVKSRIYKSTNMGKTWKVYDTPIIQGESTQGIYSIDFYNKNIGIAIGGDYTKPDAKVNNLIKTTNRGKSWKVVNHSSHPGYRSCIQYIPHSKGQKIMAVGFKGIDYSVDGGETWAHLSNLEIFTIRFLDEHTAFAAGKNGVYRIDLN